MLEPLELGGSTAPATATHHHTIYFGVMGVRGLDSALKFSHTPPVKVARFLHPFSSPSLLPPPKNLFYPSFSLHSRPSNLPFSQISTFSFSLPPHSVNLLYIFVFPYSFPVSLINHPPSTPSSSPHSHSITLFTPYNIDRHPPI